MQSEQFQLHCEIEQKHWWFVARRQIIGDLIRQLVPAEKSQLRQATVIDVGCGTGANIAMLADGYHAVGIDTSAEAIQMAAERFPRVDFRAGYAPDDLQDCLPAASLVMLNDVLEHVADDFQLFSKLLAAIVPGTYVLLTVPANMALWSPHDEAFGHYRRYTESRLREVWAGLPVDELMVSHFNSRLFPVILGIRRLNRWRGKTAGDAGTDFSLPNWLSNRILTGILAGEGRRLRRLITGDTITHYPCGVSLIAVLRRRAGEIDVREKPASAAADPFDPAATTNVPAAV